MKLATFAISDHTSVPDAHAAWSGLHQPLSLVQAIPLLLDGNRFVSGPGVDSTKPNGSSTPALCHTLVLSSSSSISRPGVDSTNPT